MGAVECGRERDVLDAVAAARWPGRCDGDLLAHVSRCDVCRDLSAVAPAIAADADRSSMEPQLPSPAAVWLRAQTRARQEAVREAAAPITVAQFIGGTGTLAATVGLAVLVRGWLPDIEPGWFAWFVGSLPAFGLPDLQIPEASDLARWWWVGVALLAWLLLPPLALYLAGADD